MAFKTLEDQRNKWKLSHGIKEKQISGKSLDVTTTTIESWMERIQEFCKVYEEKDIINVNES